MDLHDYLKSLSTDALRMIASTIGVAEGARMRTRMIHEIRWKLSGRAYLDARMDRLEEEGRRILRMIVLSGEMGVSREALERKASLFSTGAQENLLDLIRHGIVGARDAPHAAVRYYMPLECREALVERVYEDLVGGIARQDGRELSFPEEGHGIVRDIFSFLCYIHRERVRLTQKRTFRKRTLRTILRRFEEREQIPPGTESCPPRLGAIIRYCYERGLIEREGDITRTTDAWLDWLELSEFDRRTDLSVWWLLPIVSHHPCAGLVLELLRRLPEDRAFSRSGVVDLAFRYAPEASDPYETESMSALFDALRQLGLIRTGLDRLDAFSVTALGRQILNGEESPHTYPPPHLFVQPNYEVLIPREFDLKLRFQLERFAIPVTIDRMITYRITDESIYWSLENGATKQEILSFLEEHSVAPVAQNLRYFISDVANRWGEIYFADLFLLLTRSSELATELKSSQRFSGLIRGEIGPTALIVERSDHRRLMEELRSAGYMPRATGEDGRAEPPPGRQPSGRNRLQPASLEELDRAARGRVDASEGGHPIDPCVLLS